jgi:hypothetical protein
MTDPSDEPSLAIDLGGLDDDLERLDYPATKREVLDAHGDRTIELAGRETTLETVISQREAPTFESSATVIDAVYAIAGAEAVDRQARSDRVTGAVAESDESD